MDDTVRAAASAAVKALGVLELVALRQPIGVSEIARLTGLPKSTVQRILEELAATGWLRASRQAPRRWTVTRRVLALGLAAAEGDSLMEIAPPLLTALRDRTRETVHLVVHDGDSLVVALRMDGTQAVRTHVEAGARSPLHATSSGVAFLAALSDARVEEAIARDLPRFTETTPADPEAIRREIVATRRRGYAVNAEGWWRPEVFAVAAAVRDAAGEPIGALTISTPASRFTEETSRELGPQVAAAAEELSQALRLGGAVS